MSKYGLKFEKKTEDCVEFGKTHHVFLTEDTDKSFTRNDKRHHNLLIEGENYQALRILNYTHAGKVDVIYIDPPYNTGSKDFVYNDALVDKEDSFRHSKWLSFMERRLKLAHKLLSERGVLFISIDDNEFAQLKLLCDEVFGEENFIACNIVVNNPSGRSFDNNFSICHEYLLVYAKCLQKDLIGGRSMTDDERGKFKFSDEISSYQLRDLRKSGTPDKREDRPGQYYPIFFNPKTQIVSLEEKPEFVKILPLKNDGSEGYWRWAPGTFKDRQNTEIVIKAAKGGKYGVYVKMRDVGDDAEERTIKMQSIFDKSSYASSYGASAIKELFGDKIFDFTKSPELIKDIVRCASQKNSIILDFFAGSGTTGQAVAELNKEDGGTRQFILCTNNDKSDKLPNGICHQVTYPRLEKTIGDENLKCYHINSLLLAKDTTSRIEQLEIQQRLLPTLCMMNGTYLLIEENKHSFIFTNHDRTSHLGVISFTNIKQHPIDPIALSAFRKKLNTYSNYDRNPNPKLEINRPRRGYAETYYSFMSKSHV